MSTRLDTDLAEVLVARAAAMVGTLRERAAATEARRRVDRATIDELVAAGLLRVLQPARCGGHELDYGTQTRIAAELARGCASTAWVYGVLAAHAWMLGMFPGAAQDDVWGADADVLVATSFMAAQHTARREGSGLVVSGRWKFSSGVDVCQWAVLMVQAPGADGGPPEGHLVLVPAADFQVDDTWFAAGLAGSGSNDIVVAEARVPAHRILAVRDVRGGPTPGSAVNPGHLYQLGLWTVFPFCIVGPAVGAARGALDEVTARATAAPQPGSFRPPIPRNAAARVARATAMLDAAESLLAQMAQRINADARAGIVPPMEQRVRTRLDLGYVAELATGAIDELLPLAGARGLAAADPVQRAWRDAHAAAQHIALTWDVQSGLYGSVLMGDGCPDPKV